MMTERKTDMNIYGVAGIMMTTTYISVVVVVVYVYRSAYARSIYTHSSYIC